jgi:hypothetical protein
VETTLTRYTLTVLIVGQEKYAVVLRVAHLPAADVPTAVDGTPGT